MSAPERTRPEYWLLYAIAAAAVVFGLYARFVGLGHAALSDDEYYIARSVDNILRFGVPAYECGGYYIRGPLFQYLITLLREFGVSAELSARSLAAISNVLMLPAAWLLARRVGGRALALAVVAVLAVSLWEVELARFGRMYTPFQAIFAWYLVFYVRVVVDSDRRALLPMMALTVLGVFTWEGGIFMPLANLIVPFFNNPNGRLTARNIGYLAINVVVLGFAYALVSGNFRHSGDVPPFPADYDRSITGTDSDKIDSAPLWQTLVDYMPWALLGLIPLALTVWAGIRVVTLKFRWPAAVALLIGLGAALLQQFALLIFVVLIALLLGLLSWRELARRAMWPYAIAIVVSGVMWLAFGLFTDAWRPAPGESWLGDNRFVQLAYEFIRFPDVMLQVVRPWSGAATLWATALGGLIILTVAKLVFANNQALTPRRVLMTIVLCLVVVIGVADPPRQETRYAFFLYPAVVILAFALISDFVRLAASRWRFSAEVVGALACIGLFVALEDFRPAHLAQISSQNIELRTNMPGRIQAHIVGRTDLRGLADWLNQHAADPSLYVVNVSPGSDYYFKNYDATYLERTQQRYGAYACSRGTRERWGNLPLVDNPQALEQGIEQHGGAYLVVSSRESERFVSEFAKWSPKVVYKTADGDVHVLALGSLAASDAR